MRLGRSTKKYLSRKPPLRPQSGPSHLLQEISGYVVAGSALTWTTLYNAPHVGQLKRLTPDLVME